MGKTKRRKRFGYGKNKRNYPYWITLDYKNRTIFDFGSEYPQLKGKDREIAIRIFHSDSGFGDKWRESRYARKLCTRQYRRKEKTEIINMIKTGNYYDYNYNSPVRSVW